VAKSISAITQPSSTSTARNAASKENEIPRPTTAIKSSTQPAEPEHPVVDVLTTTLSFPLDQGILYSGALHERPPCQVEFRKIKTLPQSAVREVGARFASSEPYWYVAKSIAAGMTSPTDSTLWTPMSGNNPKTLPKTVASCSISFETLPNKIVNNLKNWGKAVEEPENGEYRLLLRMLPVKKKTKAMKRADCHLWPKGTFVTIDGVAHALTQRHQQSHDHNKWLGMCKHFDMGSVVKFKRLKPTEVNICCLDTDQYYFSLALCQYRSPDFLVRKLQGLKPECNSPPREHSLKRLSLQESLHKAKQLMNQHMVVLDDDDDDQTAGQGVGKFVFSLIDPLSKVPMTTPVRGKKCKHWQVRIV
jgi:hypothetical protein